MQEVAFLKNNAEKWKRLEQLLGDPGAADPDALAELFLEITDDLAYAQTFYPNSKTTTYLNALAGRLHQEIYQNKREDTGRFITFWKTELPAMFARYHRHLFYSFLFFAISMGIGMISTLNDDLFVRLILGDSYINMTEANIEKGDPMAVYKDARQIEMFLGITLNNVKVAFYCFAAGIMAAVGTVLVLFYNGVMLGTFHTFFFQKHLLGPSLLTVYIHGALEISAIIVAGCAGLVLGSSLLFPGTYTRRDSLMEGARHGLKIVVGLVPVFILAGFLESFVTRYDGMPLLLNLAVILGSFSFMLWYFIVYPRRLNRERKS